MMIALFVSVIHIWQRYSHGKYICRLFHISAQNERELDYYHHKVDIPVASQVARRPKIQNLRKIKNLNEIHEILEIHGQVLSWPPQKQISTVEPQVCDKLTVKCFIEKTILLKFMDLLTI